jgi:hypothetical protein
MHSKYLLDAPVLSCFAGIAPEREKTRDQTSLLRLLPGVGTRAPGEELGTGEIMMM